MQVFQYFKYWITQPGLIYNLHPEHTRFTMVPEPSLRLLPTENQ